MFRVDLRFNLTIIIMKNNSVSKLIVFKNNSFAFIFLSIFEVKLQRLSEWNHMQSSVSIFVSQ